MNRRKLDQKGAALTVAIIFAMIIALVAGYVLTFGYNQTRQIETVGVRRTAIYYRAQAGVVDAAWRIRTFSAPPGTACSLSADNCDPAIYYIDIDTDTASSGETAESDVKIDIGPRDTPLVNIGAGDSNSGLRKILATGLDK